MDCIESEVGLSEVIGFIMILALITVFLSIWVTYAVPADGRQDEIEHMNYIQNWFTQYKITADSLWINDESDITVSTSIMLGSQGGATHSQGMFLILMRPFGSAGTISLSNNSEWIRITNSSGEILNESMIRVQYNSSNNYWIEQDFYYQMGGVFLHQSDGTVDRIAPLIDFYQIGGGTGVNIVIININRASGPESISGESSVRIDTVLNDRTSAESVPVEPANPAIILTLSDEPTAKAWWSILSELKTGTAEVERAGNVVMIKDVSEVTYQYANFTTSLQSVAATYT